MGQNDNIQQSNIFGVTTTTSPSTLVEPVSAEPTFAGKLVDHIKFIADQALAQAANRINWLGVAANSGQNGDANSFVEKQWLKPDKLTRSGALVGWPLPAIAAAPLTLPALPDNLRVDFAKLKSDAAADVTALSTSWMAKYLPDVTNVDALKGMLDNVLNGTAANAAAVKMAGLEADVKAALKAIVDAALASLNTQIAIQKSNLAANYAQAQAGVTTALTTAKDNTTNVAWARARDQVAREAARQEAEAVSTWASKGFSLPGGTLTAAAARARQATLSSASEMAAVQAEKTQQAFLDIAAKTIDAWLREMEAQSSSEMQSYRAIVDSNLRYAELLLDANKYNAKLAFDNLGLTLDFTKFGAEEAAKYRLGVIEGINGLIHAYSGLRSNELEYLNSIARAEREAQAAVMDYYRAAISAAELGMRLDVANNENDIRWATIAAQFIGTAVGHHVQAASVAAQVFGQSAGMALSGLNAVAQHTASE